MKKLKLMESITDLDFFEFVRDIAEEERRVRVAVRWSWLE